MNDSLIAPPPPPGPVTGWSYTSGEPAICADPPWWNRWLPRRWRRPARIIRPASGPTLTLHHDTSGIEAFDRYQRTLASVCEAVQTLIEPQHPGRAAGARQ